MLDIHEKCDSLTNDPRSHRFNDLFQQFAGNAVEYPFSLSLIQNIDLKGCQRHVGARMRPRVLSHGHETSIGQQDPAGHSVGQGTLTEV